MRIPITDVEPVVDCGRRPAKAVVGETFRIFATVFREGHDAVGCNVVLRDPGGRRGDFTPMRSVGPGTDRWYADLTPTAEGNWTLAIEAWSHPVGTWRHAAEIKIAAGQDIELTFEEGAQIFERAGGRVPKDHRAHLAGVVSALRDRTRPAEARLAAATAPEITAILDRHPLRELVTSSARLALRVDRERALFGSWYEFFPRSEGAHLDAESRTWRSGTFATAAKRLPAIADMGFDVVYLPPIHPIGTTHRKGPNNTLSAGPDDPGSPWAIGSPEGGHDAIHPDLGTFTDFDAFVAEAAAHGLEIALDLALQCSPDHPWVKEHPEWFRTRADGTIAYAENPPKRYQDIYPLNFDKDPEGTYQEVNRIVRHWMSHGVRTFRVDNPHTKPVPFWERLLADIQRTDPDVIFLSEAFTRRPMLQELAKLGFHQSYTYFTWRNSKDELESYLTELATQTSHFLRPNLFVNTPDILHAYLQYGGRPAFKIRAAIAAAAAPTWGVYSGYELAEHVAVRPGSEEYLDSEKYQYRPRDWDQPDSLAPYLTTLNQIRRAHPALQQLRNLHIHHIDSDAMLAFSKRSERHGDTVIVVVNLDPHGTRDATLALDMLALGMDWHDTFAVRDEVTGAIYWWRQHNYVRLDPFVEPAHILSVSRNGQ